MDEDILVMEGLDLLKRKGVGRMMGGKSMEMGARCVRMQEVYSPSLGKNVRRCAEFADDMGLEKYDLGEEIGEIGQMAISGINFTRLFTVGLTGAASAIVVTQLGNTLLGAVPAVSGPFIRPVIDASLGVGAGMLMFQMTQNEDLAAGVALGPVILSALKLFGRTTGFQGLDVLIPEPETMQTIQQIPEEEEALSRGGMGIVIPEEQRALSELNELGVLNGSPMAGIFG